MAQRPNPKNKPEISTSSSAQSSIRARSIWQSYAVLPAKTRLRISLAVTGIALAGIIISNQLEKVLPPPPPEKKDEPLPSSAQFQS